MPMVNGITVHLMCLFHHLLFHSKPFAQKSQKSVDLLLNVGGRQRSQ